MTAPVIDRGGVLSTLAARASVELELGCGAYKKHVTAIGIDAIESPGVDLVGDVYDALRLFPDGSVDAVYSYHFAEHLDDIAKLVREVQRVLKPGGLMRTVVPHFSNPYFYSDYTHRSAFGLYSFSYLAEDRLFRRRVRSYIDTTGMQLDDVELIFKATRPFYVRHAFRRCLGIVVNLTRLTQEMYEAGWTSYFSCYEVRYDVVRRTGAAASLSSDARPPQ